MAHIVLIHWNQIEGAQRAECIRSASHEVVFQVPDGPAWFRDVSAEPPELFVIDLTRLPAQGRDMTFALREYKTTRATPVVFVGGDPMKVARIRQQLPDAIYTDWDDIDRAIARAIAQTPKKPTATASRPHRPWSMKRTRARRPKRLPPSWMIS